eukprot:762418-Hanusia_phi.AAC.2
MLSAGVSSERTSASCSSELIAIVCVLNKQKSDDTVPRTTRKFLECTASFRCCSHLDLALALLAQPRVPASVRGIPPPLVKAPERRSSRHKSGLGRLVQEAWRYVAVSLECWQEAGSPAVLMIKILMISDLPSFPCSCSTSECCSCSPHMTRLSIQVNKDVSIRTSLTIPYPARHGARTHLGLPSQGLATSLFTTRVQEVAFASDNLSFCITRMVS